MIDEIKHWCASQSNEVYGWLGFVLAAALMGCICAASMNASLYVARRMTHGDAAWATALVMTALLAALSLWLLSLLVRMHGAPWRVMLAAAAIAGWLAWLGV